jgi:hypothetical protein
MIFDHGIDVFESEKERNLYYKVFAGYLLNEYVGGLETRLDRLCHWISLAPVRGKSAPHIDLKLDLGTTHVSFDNHAYMFAELGADRGEFADILIHDRESKTVITIEAKVHSDWTYAKDIAANDKRIERIEAHMPGTTFVPCLLLKKEKWEQAAQMQSHPQSNYRKFVEADGNRFRVLFWEELATWIDRPELKAFVQSVLAHPPSIASYYFDDGWFVRGSER